MSAALFGPAMEILASIESASSIPAPIPIRPFTKRERRAQEKKLGTPATNITAPRPRFKRKQK